MLHSFLGLSPSHHLVSGQMISNLQITEIGGGTVLQTKGKAKVFILVSSVLAAAGSAQAGEPTPFSSGLERTGLAALALALH